MSPVHEATANLRVGRSLFIGHDDSEVCPFAYRERNASPAFCKDEVKAASHVCKLKTSLKSGTDGGRRPKEFCRGHKTECW
jgi:hypothetical protein